MKEMSQIYKKFTKGFNNIYSPTLINLLIFLALIIILVLVYIKYKKIELYSGKTHNSLKETFFSLQSIALPSGTKLANVPDVDRKVSSVYQSNPNYKSSILNSTQAWTADDPDITPYLEFSLPNLSTVKGVVIKGRAKDGSENQYVKTFRIEYIDSTNSTGAFVSDGISYNTNLYPNMIPDGENTSYILFSNSINTKTIRICPITWNGYCSIRADLLLLDETTPTQGSIPTQGSTPTQGSIPTQGSVPEPPASTSPSPEPPASTSPSPSVTVMPLPTGYIQSLLNNYIKNITNKVYYQDQLNIRENVIQKISKQINDTINAN